MSAPAGRARAAALVLAAAPLAAIVASLAVASLFVIAIGEDPLAIWTLMLHGSFGTGYGIGQTLFKATPLIFTGLAVALAFRAGLFNIGAEGQLYVGGFAAALAGLAAAPLPAPLPLLASLLAALAAGAAWGAIPGALKARFGAHEVINTIMLNFIAFALVSFLGRGGFVTATVRTAEMPESAWLPRLDGLWPALRGSPASHALTLGLVAAATLFVLLFRTRWGFTVRATGLNAPAAEAAGIPVPATQAATLALSGAIAGLGAASFVNGYKHWFEMGFSAGAGYLGIAVALIGRNHPWGVVLAALFFGALSYGGLVVNQRVPKELVEALQGLVILLAIGAHALAERLARRLT